MKVCPSNFLCSHQYCCAAIIISYTKLKGDQKKNNKVKLNFLFVAFRMVNEIIILESLTRTLTLLNSHG